METRPYMRWNKDSAVAWSAFRAACATFPRGFSLVELLVCLGIIFLLTGLLMPGLAAGRQRADRLRSTASARSAAAMVVAYCNDSNEVFPIATADVGDAMLSWHSVLDVDNPAQAVDPDGIKKHGRQRFALSGCVLARPETMQPGGTLPIDLAVAVPVRLSEITFPSSKGLLVQWVHVVGNSDVFWTYTPNSPPVSPVAQCDGSGTLARCTDFSITPAYFENWVGHPVLSSWQGCRGVDRRIR